MRIKRSYLFYTLAILTLMFFASILLFPKVRYAIGLERNPSVDQPDAKMNTMVVKDSDGNPRF